MRDLTVVSHTENFSVGYKCFL